MFNRSRNKFTIIIGDMEDMESVMYIRSVIEHLEDFRLPEILLQQNAYSYLLNSPDKIEEAITKEKFQIKQVSVGKSQLELGLEYKLPIHGIDLHPLDLRSKTSNSLTVRENRMLKVINKYRGKSNSIVVVNDEHLRESNDINYPTTSPIYDELHKESDVYIIRPDNRKTDPRSKGVFSLTRDEFTRIINTREFTDRYKSREDKYSRMGKWAVDKSKQLLLKKKI